MLNNLKIELDLIIFKGRIIDRMLVFQFNHIIMQLNLLFTLYFKFSFKT